MIWRRKAPDPPDPPAQVSPPATPVVGKLDVLELINRLRPIAKNPRSNEWWRAGVKVTFFSNSIVKVELELENGDKYSGEAGTLEDAVKRLTSPSADIASALAGWDEPADAGLPGALAAGLTP